MARKKEFSSPPRDELFGGEFRTRLVTIMHKLTNDNYASRYTYHSFEPSNVTTCTLIANSSPVKNPDLPRAMIILGHFDDYADIESTLECAVYTVTGEHKDGLAITPQKGNHEFFDDHKRMEEVNSIFSLGSLQPAEPEEEYFRLIREKVHSY